MLCFRREFCNIMLFVLRFCRSWVNFPVQKGTCTANSKPRHPSCYHRAVRLQFILLLWYLVIVYNIIIIILRRNVCYQIQRTDGNYCQIRNKKKIYLYSIRALRISKSIGWEVIDLKRLIKTFSKEAVY
jgi:hypothetical protein